MASITIRGLDEAFKAKLRLRAARNGRSMEDEARNVLRAAAAGADFASDADREVRGTVIRQPPAVARATSSVAAPPSEARILLIIAGGIAAYKSLDLIRRLKERGAKVRCILTAAAQEFVTSLSAGALSGEPVSTDLFDPAGEHAIGHIRLARETDLIVVAPATADLMARMAGGHADDLATAVLLATNRPVLIAPAMNSHMWGHAATQRNLARLIADGIVVVGPAAGEMAEPNEAGIGRMAEPLDIVAAIMSLLARPIAEKRLAALKGRRFLVTSGPTHEQIDPVRYIANRSSGKQGHAIAAAAAEAGAEVVLVSGPVSIPDPPGVTVVKVEAAREMQEAVERALPVDVAVFAAAVADWRVDAPRREKIKKTTLGAPALQLVENPDILAAVAHRRTLRPQLVIGFAAETEKVIAHAKDKLARKGCDWIVANDVSPETGIMGGDRNRVHLITSERTESWPSQSKDEVARALVARIAQELNGLAQESTK
jgi:phosphopantothenoylcysteine decarboxylase/phosphopantothenate--cysteine ligase